jgi:hypothetical protein
MAEDELKLPKSDKWDIIYKAGKVGAAFARFKNSFCQQLLP